MPTLFDDPDRQVPEPRAAALKIAFDPATYLMRVSGQTPAAAPQAPHLSQSGLDFIKGFEKFQPAVYTNDGAGKPTVGWGHLIRPGESFEQGITQAGADRLLANDVRSAESLVQRSVKVPLSQQQRDALISLAFNDPVAFKPGSSLITALNAGDYDAAASAFGNYAAAGGHHSAGLETRRRKEEHIFRDGLYDSRH